MFACHGSSFLFCPHSPWMHCCGVNCAREGFYWFGEYYSDIQCGNWCRCYCSYWLWSLLATDGLFVMYWLLICFGWLREHYESDEVFFLYLRSLFELIVFIVWKTTSLSLFWLISTADSIHNKSKPIKETDQCWVFEQNNRKWRVRLILVYSAERKMALALSSFLPLKLNCRQLR